LISRFSSNLDSISFFFWTGFELKSYTLSDTTSPFLWWAFWDKVLQMLCLGCLQFMIILISASWVARIIGVNHLHSAQSRFCIWEKHDFFFWDLTW
jgi:hypothetical protein